MQCCKGENASTSGTTKHSCTGIGKLICSWNCQTMTDIIVTYLLFHASIFKAFLCFKQIHFISVIKTIMFSASKLLLMINIIMITIISLSYVMLLFSSISCLILHGKDPMLLKKTTVTQPSKRKHLATVGRQNLLLTGRSLWQNKVGPTPYNQRT